MKQYFAENLRKYRTVKNISQTELARKLGVSGQAVSKWECALSYPDIEMLTEIADLFEISVDALLREDVDGSDRPCENADGGMGLAQLPDDDVVRVVQCIGRRIVKTEMDPEKRMLLTVDSEAMKALAKTCNIAICFEGRADIKGNLYGADITASNGINCGNVYADGDIAVGGDVNCGNIKSDGSVTISGGANCGSISSENAVSVSGGMNCGDVEAESVNCKSLSADKVSCRILKCEGDLTVKGVLQKKQD